MGQLVRHEILLSGHRLNTCLKVIEKKMKTNIQTIVKITNLLILCSVYLQGFLGGPDFSDGGLLVGR